MGYMADEMDLNEFMIRNARQASILVRVQNILILAGVIILLKKREF